MKKINLLFVVVIGGVFFSSIAYGNKAGGDAYAFLKLGAGARAAGLGNAFVALADDSTAIYWNPAGLTQLQTKEASLMSAFGGKSELENKYFYFSVVYPIDFFAIVEEKIGFSMINYGIDGIEKTKSDNFGNLVRLGKFEDKENAFIFSYAREIFKELLSAGVNIKYITHKFDEYSGNGLGLDMGLLANVSSIFNKKDTPVLGFAKDIKMGFCLTSNFAKKWKTGHKDDGSLYGKLGLAFNIISTDETTWTCAITLEQGKKRPVIAFLGTEVWLYDKLIALRGGIDNWYLENRYPGLELKKLNYARKFSLGLGVNLNMYQIDYAVLFGRFGTKHQISTSIRF